jgi:hypothetical protein
MCGGLENLAALRSGSDEAVIFGGLIAAFRGHKGKLERTRTERG